MQPPGPLLPRAFALPRVAAWAAVALALVAGSGQVTARTIRLATPASTEHSGLIAQLVPKFKQATGLDVQVVPAGFAQAIALGRRGEVDVLLLDDGNPKEKFAAQGNIGKPVPVMFNEFLLVGPKADPAAARGKDIVEAFRKIDKARPLFISRGDKGIVHAAELRYRELAGLKGRPGGGYRECGCGSGGTLDIAAMAYGYALVDKGFWASFRNRAELVALVEGDPRLVLTWSAAPVNHEPLAREKSDAQKAVAAARSRDGQALVRWLASPEAQAAIAAYKVGAQQFYFVKERK